MRSRASSRGNIPAATGITNSRTAAFTWHPQSECRFVVAADAIEFTGEMSVDEAAIAASLSAKALLVPSAQ